MLTFTDCPDSFTLSHYAHRGYRGVEAARVDRHLAECSTCLDRVVELGAPPPGLELPDCRVVGELGRGRFGVVYKAWWLSSPDGRPRLVALKVLASAGRMEQSRFEREIAVLRKLDSPWIVKCLDAGVSGGSHYFIMDYVEGVHLDQFNQQHADDLHAKLDVFRLVCRAVAHAHARGVVHRDLKPRNIIIDVRRQPHILDFGICTFEEADWTSWERVTLTNPGDVIGTLKYMSPEQAWGGVAGAIDHRSDIWALGIMMHEIATGEYPYTLDKPSPEAVLNRIRRELPRPPRLSGVLRGRDLETLINRCLVWETSHRLDSASHLADELDRFCGGLPVCTRPLAWPHRLRRLTIGAATRSRWVFSVISVTLTTLILAMLVIFGPFGWRGRTVESNTIETSALAPAALDAARDEVVVVTVGDETVPAVMDFALKSGIEGVTPDVRTWRAVHGRVMERLATVEPRVVAWDYYFSSSRAADDRFIAGIQRLEVADVPVVLAATRFDETGQPAVSPTVAEALGTRLRTGLIVARHQVRRPGELVLTVKRPDGVTLPALSLTAWASARHPDAVVEVDWPERLKPLELVYRKGPSSYLRNRDFITVTRDFLTEVPHPPLSPGDIVAAQRIELALPERWAARCVPYEQVLAGSEDELRTLLANRYVLIGDTRTRATSLITDRHPVKYESAGGKVVEDVPGVLLHADSLAALLAGSGIQIARTSFGGLVALIFFMTIVGCVLPIAMAHWPPFDHRSIRYALFSLLGTGAVAGLLVASLTNSATVVHIGLALTALLLTMALSFRVELTRNRFQVLDRRRRAVLDQVVPSDGTVTLATQRTTWHPEG